MENKFFFQLKGEKCFRYVKKNWEFACYRIKTESLSLMCYKETSKQIQTLCRLPQELISHSFKFPRVSYFLYKCIIYKRTQLELVLWSISLKCRIESSLTTLQYKLTSEQGADRWPNPHGAKTGKLTNCQLHEEQRHSTDSHEEEVGY